MNLAIIPARSGSKRIKNKNIKTFFSKPVISYSILAAKKSKLFKYVIVSTDPKNCKNFQKDWCISFFLRPKKISKDISTTQEVINHSINWFAKKKI